MQRLSDSDVQLIIKLLSLYAQKEKDKSLRSMNNVRLSKLITNKLKRKIKNENSKTERR